LISLKVVVDGLAFAVELFAAKAGEGGEGDDGAGGVSSRRIRCG